MKKTDKPRRTSQKDDYAIRRAVMPSHTSSYRKLTTNLLKNGIDE